MGLVPPPHSGVKVGLLCDEPSKMTSKASSLLTNQAPDQSVSSTG